MRIEVHHYIHHSSFEEAGTREILHAIRQMETRMTTALQDAIAGEDADIAVLAQEVQQIIDRVASIPAEVAAAVQEALDAAGVDDETARAAVTAADEKVKGLVAAITDALASPTPPTDTVPAGGGDDTIAAPAGDDVVVPPPSEDDPTT